MTKLNRHVAISFKYDEKFLTPLWCGHDVYFLLLPLQHCSEFTTKLLLLILIFLLKDYLKDEILRLSSKGFQNYSQPLLKYISHN